MGPSKTMVKQTRSPFFNAAAAQPTTSFEKMTWQMGIGCPDTRGCSGHPDIIFSREKTNL